MSTTITSKQKLLDAKFGNRRFRFMQKVTFYQNTQAGQLLPVNMDVSQPQKK